MPKKGSEVPHTAFSHHRIGIHREQTGATQAIAGLTPVLNTSSISAEDLERCMALAKFQVLQEDPGSPSFRSYGMDAARSLIGLKNAGKDDPDSNTVLALLARDQGQPGIAKDVAEEVIATEASPSRARIESVRLLAQLAYQRREYEQAIRLYQQLTQYAQEPVDFFYLGISQQNQGDSANAVESLKRTVALAPAYVDAHQILSAILIKQGRTDEGAKHADLAKRHAARLQRLGETGR
jgi:tetratricopeptide (TPR) repeat protein